MSLSTNLSCFNQLSSYLKMIIKKFIHGLSEKHNIHTCRPAGPLVTYKDDRTLLDIGFMTNIDFDIFAHLRQQYGELGRRLEVLDGGCGYGFILRDLKRGFKPDRRALMNSIKNPLGKSLREGVEGLGEKIRTTGVTLNQDHVNFNIKNQEENQIDEIILSPLERYPFSRNYDFVFDFTGPAFYFTFEAMPVYGRILQKGGFALLRIPFYAKPISNDVPCSWSSEEARKKKIENLDSFLAECGMKRLIDDVNIREQGPADYDAVFLVRKV